MSKKIIIPENFYYLINNHNFKKYYKKYFEYGSIYTKYKCIKCGTIYNLFFRNKKPYRLYAIYVFFNNETSYNWIEYRDEVVKTCNQVIMEKACE